MPSDEENVKYLYQVLTLGNPPNIDFEKVGGDLELKSGAVSKRWSRLKQAMNAGKPPGPSTYQFLWLCVKYNKRDTPLDWSAIAAACNLTAGAASKRYSRMKIAFEKGEAMPTVTEKKAAKGGDGSAATAGSKRKRAANDESQENSPETETETKAKGKGKKTETKKTEPKKANAKKAEPKNEENKPKRARTVKKEKDAQVKVKEELEDEQGHEEGDANAADNEELIAELHAAVNAAGGEVDDEKEEVATNIAQARVIEWLKKCRVNVRHEI